jgi:TRAP-type C4-dicarboxylate transport system permease small subunit
MQLQTLSSTFWRWYDRLVAVSFKATLALLMFIALSIGFNVLMRRVFDNPVGWVIQGGQYTLVYITFMAAPRLLQVNAHTRMTLLTDRLRPHRARLMKLFSDSVSAAICLVLFYLTAESTINSIRDDAVYRGNFDIDRAIIWWVMPYGFLLLLIEFLREAWQGVLEIKAHRGAPDGDDEQTQITTTNATF